MCAMLLVFVVTLCIVASTSLILMQMPLFPMDVSEKSVEGELLHWRNTLSILTFLTKLHPYILRACRKTKTSFG